MAKMATKGSTNKNAGKERLVGLAGSFKWMVGLLAGGLAAVAIVFATLWLFSVNTDNVFPINRIEVRGQHYVQAQEIHSALKNVKDRGFFTMDMQLAETKLLEISWINHVQLRKVWPDTLQVSVVEHVPFAYWGEKGVVSTEGRVFYPLNIPTGNWVHLQGPSHLAKELIDILETYQSALLEKNMPIQRMDLSESGALNLELSDGLAIRLGKVHREERLERLIQHIEVLKAHKSEPLEYVDLRYQNGMTAKWVSNDKPSISGEGSR